MSQHEGSADNAEKQLNGGRGKLTGKAAGDILVKPLKSDLQM